MIRSVLLSVVTISVFALILFEPATAASNTRFKQWIAPLECVESHVADGENTTVILTPQQCDELLHPPKNDHGGGVHPGKTPHAPDTGVSEELVFSSLVILLLGMLGITMLLRDRHLHKMLLSDIITARVSSSRSRKRKVYKPTADKKKTRK